MLPFNDYIMITISEWINVINLPVNLRIVSLAMGQLYYCLNASEVILKDMGKQLGPFY